ncbi:MAG: mevalonate kinase, partial [Euryarchaeota archaeon]|nr:mevalonate kinase [Euryarchaeota archaeon]
ILLGEHAVVFGQPAIALAISLRLRCSASPSSRNIVNGQPLSEKFHPYIHAAIGRFWDGEPLSLEVSSDLPSGSGLGSSAAVTVAVLGALDRMRSSYAAASVAERAFEVESIVQGRASPVDTSTCTHGRGIFVDRSRGDRFLWEIRRDTRKWFIHDCEAPDMGMVVGYTGVNAHTGPLVAKVKRFVDRSSFGRELIEEIGQIAVEGRGRLMANDKVGLGRLMNRNQKLLAVLGVSSPELEKLIDASLPHSYGAKLTGAGGGGSMIALTDEPQKVCDAIARRGGTPFIVRTGVEGLKVGEA